MSISEILRIILKNFPKKKMEGEDAKISLAD
jgi:hypothetical protein